LKSTNKILSWKLPQISHGLASGEISADQVIREVVAAKKRYQKIPIFLNFNEEAMRQQADSAKPHSKACGLAGIPVSVKDNMDVAGVTTTCGSSFYAKVTAVPAKDAPFVKLWLKRGAMLVGKTHLNEFAYGITGENPWFGDCTIPGASRHLTGGSSSGAAASVVAGAAAIALGTDTGGSLRVPAALCGLVSFRAPGWFPNHRGVVELAGSFDAMGWLNRHVSDISWIASALFPDHREGVGKKGAFRIGILEGSVLKNCESEVLEARDLFARALTKLGHELQAAQAEDWEMAGSVFTPVQAHEAWKVHRKWYQANPEGYSAPVRSRLEIGSKISRLAALKLYSEKKKLSQKLIKAFGDNDFLILPATPFRKLEAGKDQSQNRPLLLGLNTPASVCGLPVLTVPWKSAKIIRGIGFQIIGRKGAEWSLVKFSETLEKIF